MSHLRSILLALAAGGLLGGDAFCAAKPALRDDGTYQNGGYWATPLPWLMVTVMREDPARAARLFCEAVEDFQARGDINEWVNDNARKRCGVRDYCASAAMPLAGVRRLRAYLAEAGQRLAPELARRLDAAQAWLEPQARRVLRGSSKLGKGGVRIFTPDATGGYGAFWVRDWSYMIEGFADAFSQSELRDGYLFLAAAQRADGCMPDRVAADGHGVYSPGGEARPFSANGSVDQSPFMVIVCHQYWKRHGDLEPFRRTAAALEKAMRFTPRNPANGLVHITDAKLFRPYSFLDTVPLVGDQQFDSVLFWDACRKLAEMFQAAGDAARAEAWRREATRVLASLGSLWDQKQGLFVAASQNWRQPSIWGSVFAVYAGAATPDQARRIARWCLEHEDLIVFRGQVRHLPKGLFWGQPEPSDSTPSSAKTLWLEAEEFASLGGWVIDPRSVDQMGSAYVMAHGMGVPVQDAETACTIPERARWTVWARTRDWTAPWKRGRPAGRFQVLVDGRALSEILGTNGASWGWQKAGTVELEQGSCRIALHDLTGFNGRCDALCLTTDAQAAPENDPAKLPEFRRKLAKTVCRDDPVVYDLAVAGGGVPGMCTAIAAARTGSKVVLIQDRSVLGGNNSSEIRVGLGGQIHLDPYPRLGNVVQEISPVFGGSGTYPAQTYEDARKENVFRLLPRGQCRLVLNERVVGVETDKQDPHTIAAFIGHNLRTGAETRYRARLFADCTGDAVVARKAGAQVMYGRESRATYNESLAPEKADRQVMGHSVLWYATKADRPTPFPDVDWGVAFNESNVYYVRGGDWEWETGQDRDQVAEAEYIRDYGMMAIYANWAFLKNHSQRKAEWACDTLSWVSPVGGTRESYRVVGDYILTQNDIEDHVPHRDATASITWSLDLHFPDPENAAKFPEPFRSCAYHRGIVKPYAVPYRCLYARDVHNLFLAGRDISMSHVAFSAVRVMRTLGMLGEVVGLAAGVCKREGASPRDVYEKHFDKLKDLMRKGVPVPSYHAYGAGTSETYHFKDTGHIRVNPPDLKRLNDPALKPRIEALNVEHKKWPEDAKNK